MGESTETLFEKFDILECLKKDAGAAVYLANHIFLGKQILLKTLDRDNIPDLAMLSRFQREAKTLAKLDHPNIIKVLDFGMHKNFFYISFEFFESRTLRDVITSGNLSAADKRQVLIQLFRGLDYAHSLQVVHRDIKPENILLDENNVLKIADFGLALIHGDESFTQQSTIVGTPSYMSPEQISGKELTAQSDLFSAGVVAYELVTGRNPFLGNDVGATLNNIFAKEVTLESEQCADESVRELINQLLMKKASERLATAKEALAILDAPPAEQTIKSVNAVKKRRGTIVGSISLIIVMSVVIFLMLTRQQNERPEVVPEKNIVDSLAVLPAPDSLMTSKMEALTPTSESDVERTIQDDEQKPAPSAGPGRLHINCLPWAHVWINGDSVNTTPLSEALSLEPGEYEIRLQHPSYPAHVQNIRIEPEKDVYIKATLYSYVLCNIYPWGDVYIDGTSFGQTPFSEAAIISPGTHILVIKNQQYGEIVENFEIAAGDTLLFTHNFEQESR